MSGLDAGRSRLGFKGQFVDNGRTPPWRHSPA